MHKEFFNSSGKLAGTFKDGIYRKKVDSRKHQMRMFGGSYAIDKAIVEELKELGCTEIRILETDSNFIRSAQFEIFLEKGIERDFDGLQVFLPLKYFAVDSSRQEKLIN